MEAADSVEAFQARRGRYLRSGYYPSLLGWVAGFVVAAVGVAIGGSDSIVIYGGVAVIFAATVWYFYTRAKYYRCPVCEKPITASSDGEQLNPDSCSHCNARLQN